MKCSRETFNFFVRLCTRMQNIAIIRAQEIFNLQFVMYIFYIIIVAFSCVHAWDSDQLEVFDVVEEVKANFYDALNLTQDADSTAIRTAFRKQSLVLHPDKNPGVDTSKEFRNLVAIYEVLKDPNKRKYYDDVLANGLPNWRSAVYYYRKVRRMGLLEMSIILFCIITVGQYLVSWAAYLEQKYTLEQVKGRKLKKMVASIELPKPSCMNTLPFQIPKWIFSFFVVSLPSLVTYFKQRAMEKVEEVMYKEESEEEAVVEMTKPLRKRKPGFVLPEGPNFEVASTITENSTAESQPPPVSGGLWTDDDLEQLINLVKKYPGGTPGRWELIAEALGRLVPEVTYMANKMKQNCYRLPSQQQDEAEEQEQPKVKQKTKGGKLGSAVTTEQTSIWSQVQQKALEEALTRYPKGSLERWERIADCVPGRTKEECMLRYRSLVETVRNKKKEC